MGIKSIELFTMPSLNKTLTDSNHHIQIIIKPNQYKKLSQVKQKFTEMNEKNNKNLKIKLHTISK